MNNVIMVFRCLGFKFLFFMGGRLFLTRSASFPLQRVIDEATDWFLIANPNICVARQCHTLKSP